MPNKVATATIERRVVRCAIYTRKSTEEGLEQEFNSLDAQYEACDAFITSQRHEGWKLVNKRFDDGGFSGGTMERPGLKRILADVEAGKVDVIVVYKVDRLTRTLSDFARIVDVLDAREASFVSVTQSFNTTTSMGRLTLNVLLSFAQFEREVTGERIRDKIAASKKKGMEYVLAQHERTITELAREKHQCRKRMTQLIRIAWLSPSIVRMILKGKQPAGLTPARLLGAELPLCWTDQRRTLGFG